LNALGRPRGGFSTNIHVLTEAQGMPIAVHLTPSQAADIFAACTLLAAAGRRPREGLSDKGHDSNDLRAELYLQGSHPIIAWKSNCKKPGTLDRVRCAKCSRIQRMMGVSKQFRRVATRHDKTATSILSFVRIYTIHRWMRYVQAA
jgi:transposase